MEKKSDGLSSKRGADEVEKEQRIAKEDGPDGVPHYVVGARSILKERWTWGTSSTSMLLSK